MNPGKIQVTEEMREVNVLYLARVVKYHGELQLTVHIYIVNSMPPVVFRS